jgi:hypothetical protein
LKECGTKLFTHIHGPSSRVTQSCFVFKALVTFVKGCRYRKRKTIIKTQKRFIHPAIILSFIKNHERMKKILFYALLVGGSLNAVAQKAGARNLVNCTSIEVQKFCNLPVRAIADSVILMSPDDKTDWSALILKLKELPALKYVELNTSDLEQLPAGFNELKQITAVGIKNSPLLDLSKLVETVKALPLLRSLSLEIGGIDELPANINTLMTLEELNLQQEFTHQEKKQENVTLEFHLPVALADKSRKEIKINYTGTNAEDLRDDMTFFPALFPGTYTGNTSDNSYPVLLTKEVLAAKNVFTKKYENVRPPLRNVDVERSYYEVNSGAGGIIFSASGTQIHIPANAFVDANGNPVSENVVINYREFKDPVDFILSGIPMTYDSGGTSNTFQSAGMFEMNASANGKEVFLAPGKKLSMDFTSTDAANTYNFYAFNDKTNNWDNIGKPGDARTQKIKRYEIFSGAWKEYKLHTKTNVRYFDTLSFEERFESPDHLYTSHKKHGKKEIYIDRKKKRKNERLLRITSVSQNRDGEVKFQIKHYNAAHPELSAFSNHRWMLADKSSASAFRSNFSGGKYYSDIRIADNGGSFEVQLKTASGIKSFSAVPLEQDEKKRWVEMKDGGASLYKKYNRALKIRGAKFNRRLKRNYLYRTEGAVTNVKSQQVYAVKQARYCMTGKEKGMAAAAWIAYAENLVAHEKEFVGKAQANNETIMRSLELDGFGIYNCDQVARMQEPIVVLADYQNETSQKLHMAHTYVICKGINAVFSYHDYVYQGMNTERFAVDKAKDMVIFSVENDGNIAVFTREKIKDMGLQNNGKFTFSVKEISGENLTVHDLRALAGF